MADKLNDISKVIYDYVLAEMPDKSDPEIISGITTIIQRRVVNAVKRGFAKEYLHVRAEQKKFFLFKKNGNVNTLAQLEKTKLAERELDKKAEAALDEQTEQLGLF